MGMKMLRLCAIAEAVTLVILVCVAVPLKHVMGIKEATAIMGPVHGVAFLLFIWLVLRTQASGNLPPNAVMRLVIGAFIPFGGFLNERWLRKHEGTGGASW